MGWDEDGRATTPPRGGGGGPEGVARRATTPPRGDSPPPVAPRPTALNAGFGGEMPVVMGTVVQSSPTSRTRLSRAGDEVSDAMEFSGIQSMRQSRPSDVVLAEPASEIRLCGKYIPRARVLGGAACCAGLLLVCIVVIGAAAFGGGDPETYPPDETPSDSWSYEDMPHAVEVPTSSPHVELELRADISAMPEGSDERREFESTLISNAAAVMGISRRRIVVLDLRAAGDRRRRQLQSDGLVLVMLGIVPASAGERSATAAVATLAAAVTVGTGELPGVLSGARVTASGNMLGEVGEVQLSQILPCSRSERPDVNGNTCAAFVQGGFHDCTTMMAVYGYDCVCSCDELMQPRHAVQWTTISLSGYYQKPVVIVSPASWTDAADAHVRVRKSSPQSFQLALQEPSCLDQQHAVETVSWMVVEAGLWNVDVNVPTFEADTVAIAPGYRKERWKRVALSERLQVPVVVSHLMTSNEGHTSSWSRLAHLDPTGFDIALEEASWDGHHAAELCGWVAFEAGSSRAGAFLFEAGRSDVTGSTSSPTEISFGQPFDAQPLVFGSVVSTHACCSDQGLRCDGDTSALRFMGTTESDVSMRVKEMVCGYHTAQGYATHPGVHDMDENVAYIAMATDGATSSGSMIATVVGCDGAPDGKQLDECGVCGGDGSSCRCWSHIDEAVVRAEYIHLGQVADDGSVLYSLPDDGLTGPIALGFTFSFYSVPYTQLRLSANGYLHFGAEYTPYGNTWPIPSVTHPNNLAAVFWTDLDPSSGGEIRGWGDGQMKVFEWNDVPLWSSRDTAATQCSFEVQIRGADNSMLFLYEDVSTKEWHHTHAAVTIGVEDVTGEDGVQIEYSFDFEQQWTGVSVSAACHAVIGCDDVEGSGLKPDACGVCAGDGTSCKGCMSPDASNYDPTASIPDACTWNDCVDSCPSGGCSGSVVWGGLSQFAIADFSSAVTAGTQSDATMFGHAFVDEYGLTMDGSGDFAKITGTDTCIETAGTSVPADAANCLAVALGQAGSQAACEAVMTEADASVRACTYTASQGLPDYSADASFTIAFWFSKLVCDPGGQYEFLWSHVEHFNRDILRVDNSNINIYLSCTGYGAFSLAEGGPGEGSTFLRTNLVDSVGERANWDSLLHVDGFDAVTEQWVNVVMSFSTASIETWIDGLADHDFSHHMTLQSCTENAAFPDPTALNTALTGFTLSEAPLFIGGRADLAPDRHFQGTITGATVYGYSLQADEVHCNWAASEDAVPTLPANFYGCTDEFASNYDANARVAAATCTYPPPCWEYTEAEWIDATGGERHEIADDAHVRVDLPFTFTWYSASFDFVKIASNGFLTFGDGDLPEDGSHVGGAHTRTAPAPDAGPPNNAAFVWWTDLDPSVHGGMVFTLSSPTQFVVEWNSPVYGAASSDNNAHFQIVLSSDGGMRYNYQQTPFTAATWAPIAVGVEGGVSEASGAYQRGMTVSYNQPEFPVGGQSVYFAAACIG